MTFASSTSYTNKSGENATLNVTDNQALAMFTVQAAGSSGNPIPYATTVGQTPVKGFIYSVGGIYEFKVGSTTYYQSGYGYGTSCSYGTFCFLSSGYGYGSLGNLLTGMHSTYMFTGTGSGDKVTLTGGLTHDIFSITATGANDGVTINSGLGSSTYNIVLGPSGTLTLSAAASVSANNYYNIVYQVYVS